MIKQLINDEKFTNIQKAQAGLSKLFLEAKNSSSFFRVMRGDEPLGVLIPNEMWESLTEDIEAMSSPTYIDSIARARQQKGKTLEEVKKSLNL